MLMPGILGTFSVLFANALAAYATVYALMMNNISLLPIQIAGSFVGEVKLKTRAWWCAVCSYDGNDGHYDLW